MDDLAGMAIEGYFQSEGGGLAGPYVRATVMFPRLYIAAIIEFLIDSGAESTALHSRDIERIQVDYRRLRRNSLITGSGVGGRLRYYREPAIVVFRESDGSARNFAMELGISERTRSRDRQRLPSLLGRDFLNHCTVTLDHFLNRVSLEPRDPMDNVNPALGGGLGNDT